MQRGLLQVKHIIIIFKKKADISALWFYLKILFHLTSWKAANYAMDLEKVQHIVRATSYLEHLK